MSEKTSDAIQDEVDDSETISLLVKTYHRMLTQSKPLDADMAKVLQDNIFDLF